jgi:hypothetical protein
MLFILSNATTTSRLSATAPPLKPVRPPEGTRENSSLLASQVGYVVIDIHEQYSKIALAKLNEIEGTIRCRVLF